MQTKQIFLLTLNLHFSFSVNIHLIRNQSPLIVASLNVANNGERNVSFPARGDLPPLKENNLKIAWKKKKASLCK